MSLTNRFKLMSSYNDIFGFFSDVFTMPEDKNLHFKLTYENRNESDIDGNDLLNELNYFLCQMC